MPRRYYSSTAVATTLSASANNSTTSITVTALSGFPNQTPWTALIDEGTASEEVVEVTNVSGTTLTVTRGVDGTAGVSHNAGATFKHGVSGRDFDEANSHVNASSGVHGLTGSVVGTSDTQSLTNKTINSANNTLTVAQSAVTNLTTDLAAKANAANPTFTGVASFPDGSASAPSITNTGDTNTGLAFPADDTVIISTGGSERVRVDSSGVVLIGTDTSFNAVGTSRAIVTGTGSTQVVLSRFSNDSSEAGFSFVKSRGTTSGTHGAVQGNDTLGTLRWVGSDGTSYLSSAAIRAEIDATPGTNDAPGRLIFLTTPDGSTTLTERMRIDSNGLITGTGTSLGAWTTYTPTLGGTGWALGDGTITGVYCQIGKIVVYRTFITFGSTSTYGAGSPTFSLPVTSVSGNSNIPVGIGVALDSSLSAQVQLLARISSTTTAALRTTTDPVTSTAPFSWASSDVIAITGTYQAA